MDKKKIQEPNKFMLMPNSRKKKKAHPDYVGYGTDENGRRFRLVGWALEMKGKHQGKTFVGGQLNYLDEEFQNKEEDFEQEEFDVNDF